jgi:hypothetical protein
MVIEARKLLQALQNVVASLGFARDHATSRIAHKYPKKIIKERAIRRCLDKDRSERRPPDGFLVSVAPNAFDCLVIELHNGRYRNGGLPRAALSEPVEQPH